MVFAGRSERLSVGDSCSVTKGMRMTDQRATHSAWVVQGKLRRSQGQCKN